MKTPDPELPGLPIRRSRPLLGTIVTIAVEPSGRRVEEAIAAAFQAVEEVQRLMSFHDPSSELSKLNLAGGSPIELSHHTLRVLRAAVAIARASDDAFNPALAAPLVRSGALPDHGFGPEIRAGTHRDLEVGSRSARLNRSVLVSLDGIAKGYAVDLATRILLRGGAASGIVNAGGDLRVFGRSVFPVHLRLSEGSVLPLGWLREGAIASSSRPAAEDPRDPDLPGVLLSGEGAEVAGDWCVLARRAFRADALTKVAAARPAHEASKMVAKLRGRLLYPAD